MLNVVVVCASVGAHVYRSYIYTETHTSTYSNIHDTHTQVDIHIPHVKAAAQYIHSQRNGQTNLRREELRNEYRQIFFGNRTQSLRRSRLMTHSNQVAFFAQPAFPTPLHQYILSRIIIFLFSIILLHSCTLQLPQLPILRTTSPPASHSLPLICYRMLNLPSVGERRTFLRKHRMLKIN